MPTTRKRRKKVKPKRLSKLAERKRREDVGAFLESIRRDVVAYELGRISIAELEYRYGPEARSLNKAKYRQSLGKPKVVTSIRSLPDFLRLVVLEIGPRLPRTDLDRVDNAGIYEPGNLRWGTKQEQALNRSTTKFYHLIDPDTAEAFTTTLPEFVKSSRCPYLLKESAIRRRMERGHDPQTAFFTPKGRKLESAVAVGLIQPESTFLVRTQDAYAKARREHFPTMPPVRGREPDDVRRFAKAWKAYGGDPDRNVVEIVANWQAIAWRAERSAGKRLGVDNETPKPWAWILARYYSGLWDALREFRAENKPAEPQSVAAGIRMPSGQVIPINPDQL